MTTASLRLHGAPWVVPVNRPIIEDGGVAVSAGKIVAVDQLPRLQQRYPHAEVVFHPDVILTPALINAHCHLELSHLAQLAASSRPATFTGWISRLLQLRETLGATGEQAQQSALEAAAQQYKSGISVVADIGNTAIGSNLAGSFPGILLAYKEYLGLAESTLTRNLHRLQQEPEEALCSGHAPYSTHGRLLQQLKRRAASFGHVFPIHTAEPAAEGEMIRQGRGEMVDFIRQRGFWDGSFMPRGSGGTVHYLHDLGLLDARTLCIHAIHVDKEEIRILAGQGSKVCLCTGSNLFLATGKAPVREYLDNGILPALGTDSLASNPEISLWREMRLLAEAHPAVATAHIFAMATRGGAEALGVEHRFGTLEPGKDADILAVPVFDRKITTVQVYDYLVRTGSALRPTRMAT